MEADIGVIKASARLLDSIREEIAKESPNAPQCAVYFDTFLEESHLLDPVVELVVNRASKALVDTKTSENATWPSKILYALCKVRGYKTVCRFLSSEVALVDPILAGLERTTQGTTNTSTWEERYCLLLWLSVLVLIPFKLSVLGPNTAVRMFDIAHYYIDAAGKERDAAAIVLGQLLTRADCDELLLKPYLSEEFPRVWQTPSSVFELCGHLQTTAKIWANVSSDPTRVPQALSFAQLLIDTSATNKKSSHHDNTLAVRLRVKNLGKLGTHLVNSIGEGLDEQQQELYYEQILDTIEQIILQLTDALSHKDTNVRYAAAKVYAQITQRLPEDMPQMCIDNIVQPLLTDIAKRSLDYASPEKWHGHTLCLAELLRRHLLSPSSLKKTVVPILHTALNFEQQRLTYSIGSNVRDAGCYTTWSMFRTYKKLERSTILDPVVTDLVQLCCFDPEINVRRAASAALQEGIGRQSNYDIELGLALIQVVEYFNIGLRDKAYTDVSVQVQDLGFNTLPQYIIDRTLHSWDRQLRCLSARALGELLFSPKSKNNVKDTFQSLLSMLQTTGADSDKRHGLVYALGELIIRAQKQQNNHKETTTELDEVSTEFAESLYTVFSARDFCTNTEEDSINAEAFLHAYGALANYQTKGSRLVQVLTNANLTGMLTLVLKLGKSDAALAQEMRLAIAAANRTGILPWPAIISDWIPAAKAGNAGYALALGYCTGVSTDIPDSDPDRESSGLTAIEALYDIVRDDTMSRRDMTTMAQAIESLTLQLERIDSKRDQEANQHYYTALVNCLNNYTNDARGDVGSWAREAAMHGTVVIFDHMTTELRTQAACRLLSMSVEALPRLRSTAFESLCKISKNHPNLLNGTVSSKNSDEGLNEVFSCMLHVTDHIAIGDGTQSNPLILALMKGYVTSAGGRLADAATRLSSIRALMEYLSDTKTNRENDQVHQLRIASCLVDLVNTHRINEDPHSSKVNSAAVKLKTSVEASRTWVRLIETGYAIPAELQQRLFVNVYNLHINTRNLERVFVAIDIFGALASENNNIYSMKRLVVLCKSPVGPEVRVKAAETLYEALCLQQDNDIDMEVVELVENTDWSVPIAELEPTVGRIQTALFNQQ